MIVVSDTSPLTALLTVGKAELLVQLFGEVLIPQEVEKELLRSSTALPSWLRVQPVRDTAKARLYALGLDRGEAEAIALAEELGADHLLMDERKGRRFAIQRGLPVLGLLGVVLIAKRKGLIPSARSLLLRLDQEAGIYLGNDLRESALKTVGE
jgi:predicted nucleic acid-binding protein